MTGIDEFTQKFFDDASAAWKLNKIRVGQMMVYRCCYALSSKRQCNRPVNSGEKFCDVHRNVSRRL